VQHVAALGRQKRLSVDCVSVKYEVLSVCGGHVIGSDVTSVWVVGWSRGTFLLTVQDVGGTLASDARVQLHVMTTSTSVEPANSLEINGNKSVKLIPQSKPIYLSLITRLIGSRKRNLKTNL